MTQTVIHIEEFKGPSEAVMHSLHNHLLLKTNSSEVKIKSMIVRLPFFKVFLSKKTIAFVDSLSGWTGENWNGSGILPHSQARHGCQ